MHYWHIAIICNTLNTVAYLLLIKSSEGAPEGKGEIEMGHALRRKDVFGVVALLGALALVVATAVMAAPAQTQSIGGGNGDAGTCFGRDVTIAGTNGPDAIVGTFGTDVIKTFDGDDTVRGEADFAGAPEGGTDYICLGDGDDVADGADKVDFINGGPGNDILDGDNFPSPFGDTLIGGTGDDTFTGGQGDDTISGGPGNDMVDIGTGTVNQGADTVNAGSGDDLINEALDGSIDDINAGPGNDTCIVDAADEVENCETVIRVLPNTSTAQQLEAGNFDAVLAGEGVELEDFGAPGSLNRLGLS